MLVLYYDQGDCKEYSLRTWIKVGAGISAIQILLNFQFKLFSLGIYVSKSVAYTCYLIVTCLISIVLETIGMVWYYNSPTCETGKL